MLEKIINSLLFGSTKTKSYLWTMVLLVIGGILLGAAGIITGTAPLWIFGIVFLGLFVMIRQSVSIRELVEDGKEQTGKRRAKHFKKNVSKLSDEMEMTKKTGEELLKELNIEAFTKKNESDKNASNQKENEEKENNPIEKYDTKMVKYLMVKYKVKKEHRKVMIDFSKTFQIEQCPAYMWKDHSFLYFLLLEEEARVIRIPLEKIKYVGYIRLERANPSIEYKQFEEKSLVTELFSEYLPQYKEGSHNGRQGIYKNLYMIAPDISFTNTSARNLLEYLGVDFMPKDEIMQSELRSEYYKKAYKNSILWRDGVISTEEYKNEIKKLMKFLVSENISREAYMDLLNQLVASKLITDEYATYYKELHK